MTIDVERARRETPGCARRAALQQRRRLAACRSRCSTPSSATCGSRRAIGGYEAADARGRGDRARLRRRRRACSAARRDEIAVVENATRAWDMAFYSMPLRRRRPHPHRDRRVRQQLHRLPAGRASGPARRSRSSRTTSTAQLSVEALRGDARRAREARSPITHVPTNGGLVNPAAAVGRGRARGRACSTCSTPASRSARCRSTSRRSAATCSRPPAASTCAARAAPGFLYVRRELLERLEPPLLDLHAATWTAPRPLRACAPDARRFENWETNYAGKVGLGVGDRLRARAGASTRSGSASRALADGAARRGSRRIPGVDRHDLGARALRHRHLHASTGVAAADVRGALRGAGINVWASPPASTRSTWRQRGLDRRRPRLGALLQHRGRGRPVLRGALTEKGWPAGTAPAAAIAAGLHVDDLPLPVLVLHEDALAHNLAAMAAWCERERLLLAPHGKTTMAPRLFRRQLDAGAWGITVATVHQARWRWPRAQSAC